MARLPENVGDYNLTDAVALRLTPTLTWTFIVAPQLIPSPHYCHYRHNRQGTGAISLPCVVEQCLAPTKSAPGICKIHGHSAWQPLCTPNMARLPENVGDYNLADAVALRLTPTLAWTYMGLHPWALNKLNYLGAPM